VEGLVEIIASVAATEREATSTTDTELPKLLATYK